MEVKYISDDRVRLTLEINSIYKRPIEERMVYNTQYAINEFNKMYPKRTIEKVLQKSKVKNFSTEGKVKGVWEFALVPLKTKQTKPSSVSKAPKTPKRTSKKSKKRTYTRSTYTSLNETVIEGNTSTKENTVED